MTAFNVQMVYSTNIERALDDLVQQRPEPQQFSDMQAWTQARTAYTLRYAWLDHELRCLQVVAAQRGA